MELGGTPEQPIYIFRKCGRRLRVLATASFDSLLRRPSPRGSGLSRRRRRRSSSSSSKAGLVVAVKDERCLPTSRVSAYLPGSSLEQVAKRQRRQGGR